MRHLTSSSFHETKAKFGERIEHATEHEIGDHHRVLHRVSESAPETIAAVGVVARHSPAADDWSSIYGMDNYRDSKLLRFLVNRPELFGVKILVLNRRIANRSPEAELAHGPV